MRSHDKRNKYRYYFHVPLDKKRHAETIAFIEHYQNIGWQNADLVKVAMQALHEKWAGILHTLPENENGGTVEE